MKYEFTWTKDAEPYPEDNPQVEDSGAAKILELSDPESDPDRGLFVRLQSWDESGNHPEFDELLKSGVKITIEGLG